MGITLSGTTEMSSDGTFIIGEGSSAQGRVEWAVILDPTNVSWDFNGNRDYDAEDVDLLIGEINSLTNSSLLGHSTAIAE